MMRYPSGLRVQRGSNFDYLRVNARGLHLDLGGELGLVAADGAVAAAALLHREAGAEGREGVELCLQALQVQRKVEDVGTGRGRGSRRGGFIVRRHRSCVPLWSGWRVLHRHRRLHRHRVGHGLLVIVLHHWRRFHWRRMIPASPPRHAFAARGAHAFAARGAHAFAAHGAHAFVHGRCHFCVVRHWPRRG